MLISYNWLKKYLPEIDALVPEMLAEKISDCLAEVEKVIPVREKLSNIIAGEVIEVNKIPGYGKLSFCTVNIGDSEIGIICGAPNVAKAQKVAVCLPGGTVYNNDGSILKIESKELAGKTSLGMICSEKELGLSDNDREILELEKEIPPGSDLIPMLVDKVLEIENKSLSHRPDCFSHKGIAREISAITKIKFIDQENQLSLLATQKLPIQIDIKVDKSLCPRFTGMIISDINVTRSPLWLQAMLSAVGLRSINNIVDITNYIMLDIGQPLHAYDYEKLTNNTLTVRKAKENEKVKTLDEKIHKLPSEAIVVSSGSRVEDIAGIMGGFHTAISEKTKIVFFEAATWDMYNIRKTSQITNIRTDASTRFEKGQDPNNTIEAVQDAVEIILDLSPGAEIASDLIDIYPEPRNSRSIEFDIGIVKRFLGIELNKNQIVEILESLHLQVEEDERIANVVTPSEINYIIKVIIPTFRHDLQNEYDLLEELARIYGYGNLKPTLPTKPINAVSKNKTANAIRTVIAILSALQMDEIYTYSFVGKDLYTKLNLDISKCLALKNPLSPELAYCKNSHIPLLVEKIIQNHKKYHEIKLFEIDRAISKEIGENKLHIQPLTLSGITYDQKSENIYLIVKGILDYLFKEINLPVDFQKTSEKNSPVFPLMHSGRRADIYSNETYIGSIAEIKPDIIHSLELPGRVGFFELNFESIIELAKFQKPYKTPSIYENVNRDLSFWIPKNIEYKEVIKQVNELDILILKKFELDDIYKKGSKTSMTFALIFNSDERTLTDKEVNTEIEKIILSLTALGLELRKK